VKQWSSGCFDLLVPIVHILFGSSELIPQAHTHHISRTIEKCGHLGETQHPQIWVKIFVTEKPITVRITATPPRLGYVVVQYHHHIVIPETFHHYLQPSQKCPPHSTQA